MFNWNTYKEIKLENEKKLLHECDKVDLCRSAALKLRNYLSRRFVVLDQEKFDKIRRMNDLKLLTSEADKICALSTLLFRNIMKRIGLPFLMM
jgi:hypothetical protein